MGAHRPRSDEELGIPTTLDADDKIKTKAAYSGHHCLQQFHCSMIDAVHVCPLQEPIEVACVRLRPMRAHPHLAVQAPSPFRYAR